MQLTLRPYDPHDFSALYKLDQSCFPPGISYSKWALQHFLALPTADCQVAVDAKHIVGFILAEQNAPLAHIITLDVAESHRRKGVGSALLAEIEQHFRFHGVHAVLLETAINNEAAIAFWQRHGYRTEAVLKRYYLGRLDAYEMRKILPDKSKPAPAQKEP
jgi:ribosomal-protein-alanine N-acetyltransferase